MRALGHEHDVGQRHQAAAETDGGPVHCGHDGTRQPTMPVTIWRPSARVSRRRAESRAGLLGRRRLQLPRRARPRTRTCAARRSSTAARSSPAWSRCRVPIVAAVNGPAVGLGCSLVALSDIVFMAESAHLADPHVAVGPGGGRRRTGDVAAAHQPAAGQGVRPDRRPHPGRARGRDRAGQPRLPRRRGARPGRWPARTGSPSCRSRRSRTPSASSTCTSSGPCWPRSTSPSPPRTARSPRPSSAPTSTASSPHATRSPSPVVTGDCRARRSSGGGQSGSSGGSRRVVEQLVAEGAGERRGPSRTARRARGRGGRSGAARARW